MKEVILDTNFILTCIRQKIDFFEEFSLQGFKILIPKQVIDELEKVKASKKKLHFREDAKLVLKILDKNKDKFKKINLKTKNVDSGLINFAKENKNTIIATLDRELKRKIKNQKLIIRGKKRLELI